MKFYARNNTAKEWIIRSILAENGGHGCSVCDLGCGTGSCWPQVLADHPEIRYTGLDFAAKDIAEARKRFAGCANAKALVADAQTFKDESGNFEFVTAFSVLEHVVDLGKFVKTVLALLKPGGKAYLNYDAGHFRSHDLRERIMVPLSQLLAKVGVQGPYMKEVDDRKLAKLVQDAGGKVERVWKFNLPGMKKAGIEDERALAEWHDFERRMNELVPPKVLDKAFWSTVMVVKKI